MERRKFQKCVAKAAHRLRDFEPKLAASSLRFDDLKPAHKKPIANEFEREYSDKWPGCSDDPRQYQAVNWKGQIYINSKDPSVSDSCDDNSAAVASLMAHEIWHIKANSNYCNNEPLCLHAHEVCAHLTGELYGSENPVSLNSEDVDRLSQQVFTNYIIPLLAPEVTRDNIPAMRAVQRRLKSHVLQILAKHGVDVKDIRAHDADRMVTAVSHLIWNSQA